MRLSPLAGSIVLALPLATSGKAASQHHGNHASKQAQGFAAFLPGAGAATGTPGADWSPPPSSVHAAVAFARAQTVIVPSVGENIPGEGQ